MNQTTEQKRALETALEIARNAKEPRLIMMDENEARKFIGAMVNRLGIGFHPDTRCADYFNEDGSPVFAPPTDAMFDEILDLASDVLDDIYLTTVEECERQGLIKSGSPDA